MILTIKIVLLIVFIIGFFGAIGGKDNEEKDRCLSLSLASLTTLVITLFI